MRPGGRFVLVAGSALLLTGCAIAVDYDGTNYRCGNDGTCPEGFVCGSDQVCVPEGDLADAGDMIGADAMLEPSWWDGGWLHRRRITVHNSSISALPEGFQVGFAIDVESLFDTGGNGQIRIMHHGDAWAQVTRVVESAPGADEFIWMRLGEALEAGGTADDYWLYYGNADPSSGADSDPADLFDFHAPFNQADARVGLGGAASLDGAGNLVLGTDGHLRTLAPYRWGDGYALDFKLDVQQWAPGFRAGFQRIDDYQDEPPWVLWASRGPSSDIVPEFLADASGATPVAVGTPVPVEPGRRLYSIERTAKATVFRFEYAIVDRITHSPFTTDLQVRLANQGVEPLRFDMIRVRRASDPAPAVSLGPQETRPN